MADLNQQDLPPLSAIVRAKFSRGKLYWAISIIIQGLSIVLAACIPLFFHPGYGLVISVVAFGLVGHVTRWYADSVRSNADALFRKVEFQEQFGWKMSEKELRDAYALGNETAAMKKISSVAAYWASKQPVGARRSAECVQESAWWSEHLSRVMSLISFVAVVICFLLGVVALFTVLGQEMPEDHTIAFGKAILSVFSLAFTGGFLRLSLEYYNFARSSAAIDSNAERLLSEKEIDMLEAARLLHEYQIVRVKSPPIPDCVHWLYRDKLNRLWTSLHQPK